MGKLQESEITKRLMPNKALFADIHVISKKFDILPDGNVHYGASIAYQDLQELREDFLVDLMDTIVDWIYSADKYAVLKEKETKKGKSEATAHASVQRRARDKFRKGSGNTLLVQGQFGELLLFHFIQKCMKAVPLLRKMKITNPKTMSRLIEIALNTSNRGRKKDYSRYTRNLLNLLYRMNREAFLQNFAKNCRISEKKSA